MGMEKGSIEELSASNHLCHLLLHYKVIWVWFIVDGGKNIKRTKNAKLIDCTKFQNTTTYELTHQSQQPISFFDKEFLRLIQSFSSWLDPNWFVDCFRVLETFLSLNWAKDGLEKRLRVIHFSSTSSLGLIFMQWRDHYLILQKQCWPSVLSITGLTKRRKTEMSTMIWLSPFHWQHYLV